MTSAAYTNEAGEARTESGCGGKIEPGRELHDPGFYEFSVGNIDYGSLSARVEASQAEPYLKPNIGDNMHGDPETTQRQPSKEVLMGGRSVKGNPPHDYGATYNAGNVISYSDGRYDVPLYTWQFFTGGGNLCPSSPGGGQLYALFQQRSVAHIAVRDRRIFRSAINKQNQFLRCIHSGDLSTYPRWMPENLRSSGKSEAVGDRD